jgi:glycosyltransferase involved in cell wall biosynthesis
MVHEAVNLTAAVIVRNELHRYLEPCVAHLLEFCDEVAILDDGSTDGWDTALRKAWGKDGERVKVRYWQAEGRNDQPAFHRHAEARNALIQFALEAWPTHVLSIDADEFVSDGKAVRAACEQPFYDAWNLCMREVWGAQRGGLDIRQDGGWQEHDVPMLWKPDRSRPLRIPDKGHATGRVPELVHRTRVGHTCAAALHFGWARLSERNERYARYAVDDGGKFHARVHIQSIMAPASRVRLERVAWPAGLKAYKDEILARASA